MGSARSVTISQNCHYIRTIADVLTGWVGGKAGVCAISHGWLSGIELEEATVVPVTVNEETVHVVPVPVTSLSAGCYLIDQAHHMD